MAIPQPCTLYTPAPRLTSSVASQKTHIPTSPPPLSKDRLSGDHRLSSHLIFSEPSPLRLPDVVPPISHTSLIKEQPVAASSLDPQTSGDSLSTDTSQEVASQELDIQILWDDIKLNDPLLTSTSAQDYQYTQHLLWLESKRAPMSLNLPSLCNRITTPFQIS